MVGASVLRTSVKCSAHRLACICSVVSAFSYLSLTMIAATLVCLQSCFVILYTVLSSHIAEFLLFNNRINQIIIISNGDDLQKLWQHRNSILLK